jgi:hypothetical protein
MKEYFYSKIIGLVVGFGVLLILAAFAYVFDDRPQMWVKPQILFDQPTIEKLENDARIKGKIAIVSRNSFVNLHDFYIDGEFHKKGITGTEFFPEEMYATNPDELETVIRIEYKKGNLIDYFKDSKYSETIEIYSCLIDISIIDYKTATVIAKEQIEDKTLPTNASSLTVSRNQIRMIEDHGTYRYECVLPVTPVTSDKIKIVLSKYLDRVKTLN